MKTKRNRLGSAPNVVVLAEPLLQRMPGGRYRIDPTCVRDLVAFTLALRAPVDRQARMTLRGAKGVERARRKAQIYWAKQRVAAMDTLLSELMGTVDADTVDRLRAEWDATVTPQEGA